MQKSKKYLNTYMRKTEVIQRKTRKKLIPLHCHNFYEMEFVSEGKCKHIINGKEYVGQRGDLFIMDLSDFHEIIIESDELILYTIQFTLDYTSHNLLSYILMNAKKKLSFRGTELDNLTNLIELFASELDNKNSFSNEYCRNLSNAVMVLICRQIEKEVSSQIVFNNTGVKLAINFIELNFQENITLDDIAKFAGYSTSYISRMFHNHMGTTVKNYLSELRFNYSARKLEFSNVPITEICFSSGFGDFSNFWRAFTKKFGCSPREYRILHRKHGE